MHQAVLNPETTIDKGENARMASFVGAIAIADLVKSTLGPRGMDKILQSVSNYQLCLSATFSS
jgi:T-complex protein 1 subunit beta